MKIARTARRWMQRRKQPWDPGALLDPPPPAAGEHTAPPDFVGVGAQKAGTTWWFATMLKHPDLRGPAGERKELHYFNRFVLAEPKGQLDGYADWFPRRAGQCVGEFTPAYMFQPWTPALLRKVAPDARILVLLRDPWQRYVSGLTHAHARGRVLTHTLAADAVSRSCYAPQLERLFSHFPRSQVLVLQYEQCRRTPQSAFDSTCDFLGVRRLPVPDPTVGENVTSTAKVAVHPEIEAALRPVLDADALHTLDLLPAIDGSLWGTS